VTPLFSDHFSPDARRLLEETHWGSGGIHYRVRHYDRALQRLPNPHYVSMFQGDRLIGHVTFFSKTVTIGHSPCQAVYLTHLSVAPDCRGRGLAGELVRAVVNQAVSGPPTGRPLLILAYVEAANTPSLSVFRLNHFQTIGSFEATVFNRIHPRPLEGSRGLRIDERAAVQTRLEDFYSDHALTDFDFSVKTEDIRILPDSTGEWRAAIQAHTEEWEVTRLRGLSGQLVLNGLCRIPWVKKHLFNPGASRFVHLSQAWFAEGGEKEFLRLLEDTLARKQVPFAVAYWDPRSPFVRRLRAAGSFGLLNTVMRTPVQVMAWSDGLPADTQRQLKNTPLFISPLDI